VTSWFGCIRRGPSSGAGGAQALVRGSVAAGTAPIGTVRV
jgi:hypothetical protein